MQAPAPESPAAPAPKPGPAPAPDPDAVPQPEALPAIAPPPPMSEPGRLPPPGAAPAPREPDAPPAHRPADPPIEAQPPTPASDPLPEADAAFRAGRYDEAGKGYAALARAHRLPAARRDHWAYCRMAAVVRRINAGPASATEWAELHGEIGRIRALSPKNWFGEYLRNLIAQRSGPVRPGELVLRGASPDDPAPPVSRRKAAGPVKLARAENPAGPAAPPEPDQHPSPTPAAAQIKWQVKQSANFCVFHADPALAERVAAVAEATREAQGRRWLGKGKRAAWTPKCDLYLYPTAADFAHATGEPEESPGVTRMGQNNGRIISRQVHLPRRPPQRRLRHPAARGHPRRHRRPLPHQAPPPLGRRGDGRPCRAPLRATEPRPRPRRAAQEGPRLPRRAARRPGLPRRALLAPLLCPERLADPLPDRPGDPRPVRPLPPGARNATASRRNCAGSTRSTAPTTSTSAGSPSPAPRRPTSPGPPRPRAKTGRRPVGDSSPRDPGERGASAP